jgi:hypothetical protein
MAFIFIKLNAAVNSSSTCDIFSYGLQVMWTLGENKERVINGSEV